MTQRNVRESDSQALFADYGKAIRSIQKQKRQTEVEQIYLFSELFRTDIKSLLFESKTETVIDLAFEEDVLRDVPLTFESEKSYENIFHPLIFQELKDCLIRDSKSYKRKIGLTGRLLKKKQQKKKYSGVEEMTFKVLVKRVSFESYKKYQSSKLCSLGKSNRFREMFSSLSNNSDIPRLDDLTFQKGDVLLLSENCLSNYNNVSKSFLSVVSRSYKITTEFSSSKTLSREVYLDVVLYYSLLVPAKFNKKAVYKEQFYYFQRLGNMITSWREHNAVFKMTKEVRSENILKKSLLTATTEKLARKNEVLGFTSNYDDYLKADFNESQYEAILSSVRRSAGVCLIQGPPGTGKTHTLVGLLNTLHINEFQKYYYTRLNRVKGSYSNNDEVIKKPRILVTAPSNAAVREVCKRILKRLFVDDSKRKYYPNVVWFANAEKQSLGQEEEMILLERQVEQYINSSDKKVEEQEAQLQAYLKRISEQIYHYEMQLEKLSLRVVTFTESIERTTNIDHIKSIRAELKTSMDKCSNYEGQLITLWEKHDRKTMKLHCYQIVKSSMNFKEKQRQIRVKILKGAEIVLTTLSSSAVSELKFVGKKEGFNVVVVDEAAQSVEPQVLIPLQYGCQKCVLVGDHMQLPATVVSETAKAHYYEQSLFERLLKAKHPYHILQVQYRCHPKIASFVSQNFYDKKLRNGRNVLGEYAITSTETGKHFDSGSLSGTFDFDRVFSPLVFFNLNGREQKMKENTSFYNDAEINAVTNIYTFIRSQAELARYRIGIISPYSLQISKIRSKVLARARELRDKNVEINTVDGFQGREFDIVILSSVRALAFSKHTSKNKQSVGFLNDQRRLNVAITRAKHSLIVVGNEKKLSHSSMWACLIKYIKTNGRYVDLRIGSDGNWRYVFKNARKPVVEDLDEGLFGNLWTEAGTFVEIKNKEKAAKKQVAENLEILSNLPENELQTLEQLSTPKQKVEVEEGEIR